jgi:hypothetical protein
VLAALADLDSQRDRRTHALADEALELTSLRHAQGRAWYRRSSTASTLDSPKTRETRPGRSARRRFLASDAEFDVAFALDGQGSEARALLLGALRQSQTLFVANSVLELSARRASTARRSARSWKPASASPA